MRTFWTIVFVLVFIVVGCSPEKDGDLSDEDDDARGSVGGVPISVEVAPNSVISGSSSQQGTEHTQARINLDGPADFDQPIALSYQIRDQFGQPTRPGDVLDSEVSVVAQEGADFVNVPIRIHTGLDRAFEATLRAEALGSEVAGSFQILPDPESALYRYSDLSMPVPNRISGERFGTAMTVEGTVAAVGAPGDLFGGSQFPGRVFIYELGSQGWTRIATLSDEGGSAGDAFGCAVALEGPWLAVGARNARNQDGVVTGGVALYRRPSTGWTDTTEPTRRLFPADGSDGDFFGAALAATDNMLAVGAPLTDFGAEDAGAVHTFVLDDDDGRAQGQVLHAPHPVARAHLGMSLSADAGMLVAGAPNVRAHDDPGSVHCFVLEPQGWAHFQAFDNRPGEQDGDHFGRAVAFRNSANYRDCFLFIGASGMHSHQGTVTAFRMNEDHDRWIEHGVMTAPDGDTGDHFGFDLALLGDTLVVGAIWEELGPNSRVGAAYTFRRSGPEWEFLYKILAADPNEQDSLGFETALYMNPWTQETEGLVSVPARNDGTTVDAGAVLVLQSEPPAFTGSVPDPGHSVSSGGVLMNAECAEDLVVLRR